MGIESLFASDIVLVPKINVDIDFPFPLVKGAIAGGGIDVGWYTNFSGGEWRAFNGCRFFLCDYEHIVSCTRLIFFTDACYVASHNVLFQLPQSRSQLSK